MSTTVIGTTISNVALKLVPTWTAICTLMDIPIWAQSQHRCSTADVWWPCFSGYGVGGLSVAPLCRVTERWPALRGLPVRGLAAAAGSQFRIHGLVNAIEANIKKYQAHHRSVHRHNAGICNA